MKKMKKVFYPALIALTLTTSAFNIKSNAELWKVKDDYSVKFTSKKFDGIFKGLKSSIYFDENNLSSSKIIASIDPNTVNTGNGMRNKHAKQGLETQKFETVNFYSTSIIKIGKSFEAIGKLTIKDITKEIKIPFDFNKLNDGKVFVGHFTVKPSEYGVKKGGTPELLEIELNIPLSK